ncbi:MAG: proton-conducting transporter membrane subunit [Sedimenticola sp.]
MVESIVWLIPLLPLVAALLIVIGYIQGSNRGEAGERLTSRISVAAVSISLLLVLLLDIGALMTLSVPGQVDLGRWFASGDYQLRISFYLDLFGLVMASVVALISLLMLRFSVNYMHRESGFQRFFIVMNLFVSGMLLIVMAGSATFTFVGWELAGISSYLLIAYAFERPTATANATRAFVTNRIGDVALISAIFLSFSWFGSVEWSSLFAGSSELSTLQADVLAGTFLVAALAKSAQLPFSPWIARALEGPTPSSAIFYGSLMSHAGIFLVIRLQPLFEQAPGLMVLMLLLGLLTALYGFLGSLVQTDVKSALIFSCTGQVGLMFLACGLGWFELAAWHLVIHAIWRAYQFLHAPALLQLVSRPARPAAAWLRRHNRLYIAVLQRFWLDHLIDWLLVKPTNSLSRDIDNFDEQVVTRLLGMPTQGDTVSTLSEWEQRRRQEGAFDDAIGQGRGLVGRFMERVASALHWFEEQLILKGGGDGLMKLLELVGNYLLLIDQLLSRPRYLLLLIMATIVVIL